MPIHNAEIATLFDHYAAMLDIMGANPFRIRAYRNAARVISALPQSVESMLAEGRDLRELPSIGEDLAARIAEIVKTGSFDDYRILQKKLPKGLLDLEAIPGLGPKRVNLLYDTLGITDLPSLVKACRAGKLAEVKGFGKTSEAKSLPLARCSIREISALNWRRRSRSRGACCLTLGARRG
jgi:DNA polymerase (family 10)